MVTTLFHLIIGVLLAIAAWKLLKAMFKVLLWLIPLLLITGFFFPGVFAIVGGFGFFLVGVLGTLLLLCIGSFFMVEGK